MKRARFKPGDRTQPGFADEEGACGNHDTRLPSATGRTTLFAALEMPGKSWAVLSAGIEHQEFMKFSPLNEEFPCPVHYTW